MAGTNFEIKIEGLEKLTKTFSQAPEISLPVYQEAINRSAAVIDSHRINPRNVPWITGELARRWSTTFNKLLLRTKPDVQYARAVQFGMPPSPGRYVPAIGKRLKNGSNIGMWPGFRGRHYMEKIINASSAQINRIFQSAAEVIVAKLAGK